VSLFTYWTEKASDPYKHKSLVLLFEQGILGDMLRSVVLNPIRPSNRLAQKFLCEIANALTSLHNLNIIHGSVKPSSIYLNANNSVLLGELAKVELDSARHTH
jgi:serine/threonine protein kinase